MRQKTKSLVYIIFFFLLLAGGDTAYSASSDQTGTLQILNPETRIMDFPDDFSFPVEFVPPVGSLSTFTLLDPSVSAAIPDEAPNETLQIYDSNDASGFSIQVAMSDMTSINGTGNIIPYTRLAMVTLAQDAEGVDSAPFNNPPGAPNLTHPSNCPWSPTGDPALDLLNQCNALMTQFTELTTTPPGLVTTLTAYIGILATSLDVADSSIFSVPAPGDTDKIRIADDIIYYTGISGNSLTGVTGIDVAHTLGEQVWQHESVSSPLEILKSTTLSDTGFYSIGFGFRFIVTPELKQDDFTGTLYFSLIAIP